MLSPSLKFLRLPRAEIGFSPNLLRLPKAEIGFSPSLLRLLKAELSDISPFAISFEVAKSGNWLFAKSFAVAQGRNRRGRGAVCETARIRFRKEVAFNRKASLAEASYPKMECENVGNCE